MNKNKEKKEESADDWFKRFIFYNFYFVSALASFVVVIYLIWTFSSLVPFKILIPYIVVTLICLAAFIVLLFYRKKLDAFDEKKWVKIVKSIILFLLVICGIIILLTVNLEVDIKKELIIWSIITIGLIITSFIPRIHKILVNAKE